MTVTTDTFADVLGGLGDAEWDRLAGDRFYSSALWLRVCALEPGAVSGGLHVATPGGGRAAIPVAAVTDEPTPDLRWHELLAARGLPAPERGGLLVGQRRGYLAHLLTGAGTDRTEAAAEVLDAVRALRSPLHEETSISRVAMYLTTQDVGALRAAGVRTAPVALTTDAWIEVPPGGYPAWLESLSGRRARSVRSEVRRFEKAGYELEHRTLTESWQDVARLLARSLLRYGRTVEVAPMAESFRQQGELAGPRAQVVLCARPGEPPVGFCLYYRVGDTVYLRAHGLDHDRLVSAAEYFNVTYYMAARLPGVRRLHAGAGTAEGKALRGAALRPLWLLDLSEDSPLTGYDEEIRAHNRALLAGLRDSSPVVSAALDGELWGPYC
ncbi:phosphatidylglycerol lysyltransferase domain-containing protein [Streptomyces kronopolitis]|uniref:phosphatidylglycerol lysyltransferase domain-containing protein n=1 Tax=Streptomyces kronopolitis TaxID=1612435 RepID=UPI00342B74B9